jgi:hypothetical protein
MMTPDVGSGVLNYGCFLGRDKPNLGLGSDSSFIILRQFNSHSLIQKSHKYSEKPQNLDNTPFTQKKVPYHGYMRWKFCRKYYGDSSEI